MAQARKHSSPPSKGKVKTAQDATQFVDSAAPGQEGVDLPGKVGSAQPAPQPFARHGPPWGADSRDPRLSHSAQAPLHLRLQSPQHRQRLPSPSPQPRARGHRAPARTAVASTSPSVVTQLCAAQSLQRLLHSSREKRTPPRPRHPRHLPRPGPRSLTPTQQAQA